MASQVHRRYCKAQQVHVDVSQGFLACAMDHQCFSDDLCPLDGAFHVPVEEVLQHKTADRNMAEVGVAPQTCKPSRSRQMT